MKIQTLTQLLEAVDKNEAFSHEIKGKRIKKELKTLSETHFQDVQFTDFEISNVAILMNIAVKIQYKPDIEMVLRLDREYPFNPPQVFYRVEPGKSEYGYCKDLLGAILKNQLWGPSLTLPTFIEKLPSLADSLRKNERINWTYHQAFEYSAQELKQSGIKLYEVQEYKWEYKILKMKKMKVLGFTPDCMLKFQRVGGDNDVLKLDFWTLIKDVTQVQAKTGKKFSLEIDYTSLNEAKPQKLYLGGDPPILQPILDSLNPIHMVQRKVKNFQKSGITDYNDAIQCYSTLVEHYSLTNKELTQRYMGLMKKLIQVQFSGKDGEGKGQGKMGGKGQGKIVQVEN